MGEPIRRLDGVVPEATAHAELSVAHRIGCRVGPDEHAAALFRAQVDAAADAAGGAGGGRPALGLGGGPLVGVLHQRSGRTDVDAGAAEVAVGVVDRTTGAELDAGGEAASGQRDRARVAQLVAGAHAAGADDAHLWVELEERVGPIGFRLLKLVVGALLALPRLVSGHLQHLARRLELAAVVLRAGDAAVRDDAVAEAGVARLALDDAVAGEAAVRVVGEDQREHGLSRVLDLSGVRADDHAVLHAGGAGELQDGRPFDLDEAGAAAGVWGQAVDVAEVGDKDAGVLDRFDEGSAVRRLDLAAVQGDLRHGATGCGPARRAGRRAAVSRPAAGPSCRRGRSSRGCGGAPEPSRSACACRGTGARSDTPRR